MKKFDLILDTTHRVRMADGFSDAEHWLFNLVADIEEASIEIASEIESLEAEVRSLEYDNENLQQEVDELEGKLDELESELKELRNE